MSNRKKPAKAVAAIMLAIVIGGCSEDNNKETLDLASKCGNIHFKTPPKIVEAKREDLGGNGDWSISLVVDIPKSDVGAFKQLSNFPDFSPGIPEWWIKKKLNDAKLAGEMQDVDQSDFEHIDEEHPKGSHTRGAVIQSLKRPESRIYVYVYCF